MKYQRIIKQRVCLALFSVGISFLIANQFCGELKHENVVKMAKDTHFSLVLLAK